MVVLRLFFSFFCLVAAWLHNFNLLSDMIIGIQFPAVRVTLKSALLLGIYMSIYIADAASEVYGHKVQLITAVFSSYTAAED